MVRSSFENEFTYKRFVESGKEAEFDSRFDAAAVQIRTGFGTIYPLYINGNSVTCQEMIIERSPINREITIGSFQKATREHTRMAISAARKAFIGWSSTDYKQRAAIFSKAADIFSKEKFMLAAMLSYENGKSRYESVGEVDEAIDFIRYYANEMIANKGYNRRTSSQSGTSLRAMGFQGAPAVAEKVNILMKPYGVFGVIAPFNFPVSIGVGMSVGAMITGNAVVFKPSSTDNMTMLTGTKMHQLFKEAGLPDGVFNYITGPGSEVGNELTVNSDVDGIAFTGSRAVGMEMISNAFRSGLHKCFVVEMGGKNPAIISKHADIANAVEGVASSAFGFAGQKCSALSRVYVHESIKEEFTSALIDKMRSLKVGNPIEKQNDIGPLISQTAYRRYSEVIAKAKSSGRVLYGGNKVNAGINGEYVEPTLIELRHDSELMHVELFLPVLGICTYKDLSEAIGYANDTEYGLCAGIYSRNKKEIKQMVEHIQAGVIYVNRGVGATTGAIVGLHTFVGWKGSSISGKGTGSRFYLQQFLKEQSASITQA